MASRKDQYACARICVEVDLEAGLLEAIKLMVGNWSHFQKLDYEQLPFKCKGCQEYGHFIRNCPKKPENLQNKTEGWHRVNRTKSRNPTDEAPKKGVGNRLNDGASIDRTQELPNPNVVNEARDESKEVEEKSNNGGSKESEEANSDHKGKDQDESTLMIK